jgi:hypothetical protein
MASVSQRIAFIQGLLDASPSSDWQVLCPTDALANDVTEIVLSLGGLAFQNSRKKLALTLQLGEDVAAHLSPRKQETYKDRHVTPLRYVTKISPLRKTEVMCISVDAPDRLYVTENVSQTHGPLF